MHHYPFNPGDYLLDTAHLSPMQDIAYRRLLDLYFLSESPIPAETDSVSRRLRLETGVVSEVLEEFFTLQEDGWHQGRCDDEIRKYRERTGVARANGKSGGRPKKTAPVNQDNQQETKLVNSANQDATGAKADATDTKANYKLELEPEEREIAGARLADAEEVEAIRLAWVRHDSPDDTRNAIRSALGTGTTAPVLLAAVEACAEHCRKAPSGSMNKFIPSALKFFQGQQWLHPEVFKERWSKEKKAASYETPEKF